MIAVQLRFQYRAYLAPGQRISAARVFGCKRVVWNDALSITSRARCRTSGSAPQAPHGRRPVLGDPERRRAGQAAHHRCEEDAQAGIPRRRAGRCAPADSPRPGQSLEGSRGLQGRQAPRPEDGATAPEVP
ncbi:helix-turn-helix domain-containing protein [Streptomyces rugosispiralis]|uniref:helix-turn-helix domain-containing protein n=1 Tax=Streptomyces rugosispiralis TaxID=2967341 RepID=UPI0037045AFA